MSLLVVQNLGYVVKGLLTRNAHVKCESLTYCREESMIRVNFFYSRSNFKVRDTWSKFVVRGELSCHKEYE